MVTAQPIGPLDGSAQVLEHAAPLLTVEERYWALQEVAVARLFQVASGGEHQPQRAVVVDPQVVGSPVVGELPKGVPVGVLVLERLQRL